MSFVPLLTDQIGNALVRSSASDVFDNPTSTTRINTVVAQFFSGSISDVLDVAATGGSAATSVNGTALFSSGTGTTTSLIAKTYGVVLYNPGFEIYASFSVSFTTPTSAASAQHIGMWDVVNDGFYLGYTGTTFGVGTMSGGVPTFVPRSSWNGDKLDGSITSNFTRDGTPEALNFTFQNVFRIRYGWYGSSPVLFEIYSPDGVWVVFHTIKHPNTSVTTSIQNPNLPVSLRITKTASDSTNLSMRCGSWTAGTTSIPTIDITNFKGTVWNSGTVVDTALEVNAVLAGSASFSVSTTGAISAGDITFEKSPDGIHWFPLTLSSISTASSLFSVYNLVGGSFSTEGYIAGAYKVRARLSTVITGSGTVNVMIRPTAAGSTKYVQVYQPVGSNNHTVVDSGSITVTTSSTGSAPAAATAGVVSAQIVPANAGRKGLVLTNTSDNTVSFGLSGNPAVLNSGITLTPRGVWVMDQYTFTTGAIAAIASAAASGVAIQELT